MAILRFPTWRDFNKRWDEESQLRHLVKFYVDQSNQYRDNYGDFSIFFKKAAVFHLGFVVCAFGTSTQSMVVYYCANFGWNRCSNLDNMNVLIFIAYGLKVPIQANKMNFWGFHPVNGQHYQRHS